MLYLKKTSICIFGVFARYLLQLRVSWKGKPSTHRFHNSKRNNCVLFKGLVCRHRIFSEYRIFVDQSVSFDDPGLYPIDLVLALNVSVLRKEALLELTRGLKELNIDMFFEAENIHTLSEDGEELISVLASFIMPKPETPKLKPYGLDDDDEAEVVKRIFSMYMGGLPGSPSRRS